MRPNKTAAILLLLGISLNLYSGDLDYVRDTFYLAVEDPRYTETLKQWFEKNDHSLYKGTSAPIFQAYEAAVTGLMGKHAVFPLKKLNFVNQAIDGIEETAARHPRVIEVRFLRFSFYQQLPAFFSIRDKSKEDLQFLIGTLDQLSGSQESSEQVPGVKIRRDMILHILSTNAPDQAQRLRLEQILDTYIPGS